jgi:hypothetical protein
MNSRLYPVAETLRRIGARERRERERHGSEELAASPELARRSATAERRWLAALVVAREKPRA